MRQLIQRLCYCLIIAISVTGCSSFTMADRWRDAADICTVTAGWGVGAKIRVGPASLAPLLVVNDGTGLRGGVVFTSSKGFPFPDDHGVDDVGLLVLAGEIFGREGYSPCWDDDHDLEVVNNRGKSYETYDSFVPFLNIPRLSPVYGAPYSKYPFYYFTQIEAVVAVGESFRIGLNPGEFIDFLLGWTTLDIMNDDIGKSSDK